MSDWNTFRDDLLNVQDEMRHISEAKTDAHTLDRAVTLAHHILDLNQEHLPRPVRPMYKVNCADCGVYVRESEFENMSTVCSACSDNRQREMQDAHNDGMKYGQRPF